MSNRTRLRSSLSRLLLVFSGSVLIIPAAVEGQKPRFVYVEEGTLDTQTGLVWGHDLAEVDYWIAEAILGGEGNYGGERGTWRCPWRLSTGRTRSVR